MFPGRIAAICAAISLPAAAHAAATNAADAEPNPWSLVWSESLSHDDNLFRLPAGEQPLLAGSRRPRADLLRIDTLGFGFDQRYSLQTLHLSASARRYDYRTYDHLDFTAGNASLRWDASVTPDLTGTIRADRSQVPGGFGDYRNFATRNLRNNHSAAASVDYRITGGWHVTAAVNKFSSLDSDAAVPQEDEYKSTGTQAGIEYRFPSGSSLTWLGRRASGRYPALQIDRSSFTDVRFRQSDQELRAYWMFSAKTRVNARITRLRRSNTRLGQADFDGTAGHLELDWSPGAKLSLRIGAYRDLTSFFTAYSSHVTTTGVFIAPVWKLGSKATLRARLTRMRRAFGGATFVPGVIARRDTGNASQLEFDWDANRALRLTASLQHESRSTNLPGFGYSDRTLTLSARFLFQ